jgi:hypothetical protein
VGFRPLDDDKVRFALGLELCETDIACLEWVDSWYRSGRAEVGGSLSPPSLPLMRRLNAYCYCDGSWTRCRVDSQGLSHLRPLGGPFTSSRSHVAYPVLRKRT